MSFGTITAPSVPLMSLSQPLMPFCDNIAPLVPLMLLSHLFDAVMHFGAFMLPYAIGAFIK